ncbi:serine hydrolase [Actinomadura sp. ATCC 31491]|uniref:Serine hydrolase n=1 Tax=Actinomadura luzonensis TaxID=2805427 RepID=A0ABT0FXM5_9ACTN|nr:serine hydrolase [Actinomadura luzonensis]MCK2217072.1 serine hydrolase [Actinomadura luzonensis]
MSSRPSPAAAVVLGAGVSAVLAAGWLIHGGERPRPPASPDSRPPRVTLPVSSPARPPDLPWPASGQAAVRVAGQPGSLRTHGEQRPVPIASLTKVMTALVVLTDHPLTGTAEGPSIEVDRQAATEAGNPDESTVPVAEGQRFTERQLLELMLIPSGNNAARLLARWDAGSEQAFAARMNATAARLGMRKTTYTGASGYEDTTVSTAADQLELAEQAMRNPVLRDVVATARTTVPGVPGAIVNTNKLLGLPGVVGLKTGTSTAAGGALLWAVRRPSGDRDRLVLGVVLRQGEPGDTLGERKAAAFAASRRLIAAVQRPR